MAIQKNVKERKKIFTQKKEKKKPKTCEQNLWPNIWDYYQIDTGKVNLFRIFYILKERKIRCKMIND